jgi:hypothetical protein
MAHRTLFGAPATSPGRWVPTVGALTCGPAWLSGGAPDKSCRLSDVHRTCPVNYSGADSRSWRVQSRSPLEHRTLSGGTPDSPVNYSEAPLRIPEGEEFGLSSLVHRTLSGGTPDSLVRQTRATFGYPLLSLLNPFLVLFIGLG